MTRGRAIEIVVVTLILCVLLGCLGWIAPFDVVFQVVAGWALFLVRVLPQVRIDWPSTLTAAVCLAVLAVGLHLFLRWLYTQVQRTRLTKGDPVPRWQPRWTAMILALVVLMFVAGISAVGITHQTTWLLRAREPLTESRGGGRQLLARMTSSNNLKILAIGAHNHHDDRKTFPPGGTFDARGNALHGWQTLLLPYIEENNLFKQIDLSVPWHHPRNATPLRTTVKAYRHPLVEQETDEASYALSHYAANARILNGGKPRTRDSITDGTAYTILAGEVWTHYHPWGHPTNWRDPSRGIHTTPDSFGSPHRSEGTTLFVMADGSVRTIRNTVSPAVLKALSTPDGGERVEPGDW
jgi:hypothetical protein